ncbi:PAS domain-containing protein [Hymenobacter aerilatus]|uniref:histidine kinase n=1 Tax=Hymenobacter aerilatus TaxID=2932251 RepID=A0A8T9STC4_9BACT|nr:PAS domain-containing protein [Hymenobacter aerilatus]UOR05065.1 PAS domain-containing protein [Hymenobacter aerilatus]
MEPPHSVPPNSSQLAALAAATALLNALPWGVLVLDADGFIRYINQQAAHWCDTPPAAVVDQPLADAPLPPALGAALQHMLASEAVASHEVWLPHTALWLSLKAAPAPDGQHWVFWENITGRKQAEAAQQHSSRLLLDLEEVAHTGSYDVDLASGSFYFSDGMYRLFGEVPKAFVPTLEFIDARSHPHDADLVRPVLEEAVRTKQPYTYRRRISRPTGEWRTLEAHGEVRCDAAGNAVQLRGLVQDITERVQAEQALHANRELLRATIDSSLDMVQVFEAVRDEQGVVVDFKWVLNNTAAEQYYGDVIGQRLRQLNPGVVEEGIFDVFRQVLETGVPDQREHHYVHEQFDGWFYQSTVKLGDGVTTTTHDISQRKQAEQELRETKELLQATLDSSHYVVQAFEAVRDASGKIVDFTWILNNRVWLERYGPPMAGKSLLQENPGVVETGLFDLFVQVVETGVPVDHEQYYAHEQFEAWFHQTLVRMRDGFVMTTAEITERKLAQQEIFRLKDELAQQAEDKYRTLFNAMAEGFALNQLVRDAHGRAVDARYLELNPAFEQQTGLNRAHAVGQLASALFPIFYADWLVVAERVLQAKQPERFEHYVADTDRWYVFYMTPVSGADLFGVFYDDITQRKKEEQTRRASEAQQAYLLQLTDALRPLADAREIQRTATRVLGEYFGLGRAMYAEITLDGETVVVTDNYLSGRFPAFTGSFPLSAYGPIIERARHGEPLIVEDVAAEAELTEEEKFNYQVIGSTAFVTHPLLKGGRWVANLVVHQGEPRRWTPDEIALLRETAERTWAAVERARAEEARRLSEERLQALVTNLPGAAVFIVGADLRYQLAEGEALYAAGFNPASLLGRTLYEAMPPTLATEHERHYRLALAGQSFSLENEAHGHTYISRGVPLFDAAGHVGSVLVVSYDITERKRVEEALRISEEQFRTFVNLVPDLLWRSTTASDTTWYNQQWYEYTGQTLEDAADYGWTDVIHPDDRAASARRYQTAVTNGQFLRQEHRIRSVQGEYRWFQVQVRPVRNEHGEIITWFGAATDIHARKLAEMHQRQTEERYRKQLEQQVLERTQQLQESRDLLQSVLDNSLISMSVLQAVRNEAGQVQDFRLALVNKELERETGRTDLVGKLYAAEYPGIRQVGLFDLMLRALASDAPQGMEYFYDHEGFSRWFTCQFVKMGDGLVATNLDITERKTAEQERLKNLRLLEQAETVAGLGSWDYDLVTNTMRWSDGMYHLLGLQLGMPVGPDVYLQFVAKEDRARAEQLVHNLTTGSSGFEETLRLRVKGQVKTVRTKAVVLRNEAGQPTRVLGVDLDISELQRLEADNLRLRLTQQQALFEAVQEAQEAERGRLAESLHNGIGQILYATKLRFDRLPTPPPDTTPELAAVRREADQLLVEAIRQTRALSHELVPLALEDFGLTAALHDICQKMSAPRLHMHCHIVLDSDTAPLPPALQMALYRMAQELAQNIVKHAHGATQASLELETMPGWVLLRAEDNGPGFGATLAGSSGLGLRSIRDRVALLRGQLQTGSAPTGGAYVRIRIPYPDFLSS